MSTYDEAFLELILAAKDGCGDETKVMVDKDGAEPLIHVTIQDQTILTGLDEDHEPDGGYDDTARGVYTVEEARTLHEALGLAIERALA